MEGSPSCTRRLWPDPASLPCASKTAAPMGMPPSARPLRASATATASIAVKSSSEVIVHGNFLPVIHQARVGWREVRYRRVFDCAKRVKCRFTRAVRSGRVEHRVGRVIFSRSLLAVLLVTTGFAAQPGMTSEQRANQYLQALRQQPSLVLAFLREMPKGGDLHNHLAGAIYAESWIRFASEDGLCVDRSTATLLPAPCDDSCDATAKRPAVRCSNHDQ